MSELRWDRQRGEWVIVAPNRQDRTYHPPADFCPLCPTRAGGPITEIPTSDFEVAVFENRFPSLSAIEQAGPDAINHARDADDHEMVAPAQGRCEIVVYSPEHEGSLGQLPVQRIERILRVWAHRYQELSTLPFVRYIFIFENRGAEIGVTLTHPHGQIYAYPFVPPIPARERAVEQSHLDTTGTCLHCHIIEQEQKQHVRLLTEDQHVLSYVPFAPRWPFEVYIALRPHRSSLLQVTPFERHSLAGALKRVLSAYDRLFDQPMPYLLALKQQATAQADDPTAHLRIELYPARRAVDKLKFRAGSETFMDVFINDVVPEEAAERLRAVLPE